MQKEITDQNVLQHIEYLVAEEERLNATPEQASNSQQRLKEIGVALTAAGICCVSAARCENSAAIQTKRGCARPRPWKNTSSNQSHGLTV